VVSFVTAVVSAAKALIALLNIKNNAEEVFFIGNPGVVDSAVNV
jgi:hypothetical protein